MIPLFVLLKKLPYLQLSAMELNEQQSPRERQIQVASAPRYRSRSRSKSPDHWAPRRRSRSPVDWGVDQDQGPQLKDTPEVTEIEADQEKEENTLRNQTLNQSIYGTLLDTQGFNESWKLTSQLTCMIKNNESSLLLQLYL